MWKPFYDATLSFLVMFGKKKYEKQQCFDRTQVGNCFLKKKICSLTTNMHYQIYIVGNSAALIIFLINIKGNVYI